MENKNNFTGIIITVIIAVILLTVLPIINGINVECPPCEECPSYNIGNVEVNPDFSSGNYTVDKGDYDYLDSVTIVKDNNLISENIKKDVNIFGVVGTYEEVGESATGYLISFAYSGYASNYIKSEYNAGLLHLYYSLDDGDAWIEFPTYQNINFFKIANVSTIKFKIDYSGSEYAYNEVSINNTKADGGSIAISDNIILTENTTFTLYAYVD